jgi:hypothetical protein
MPVDRRRHATGANATRPMSPSGSPAGDSDEAVVAEEHDARRAGAAGGGDVMMVCAGVSR